MSDSRDYSAPGDETIFYQASCYIPGLYVEKKVLLAFLWHFKVSIVWISLKTLALVTFASDHDYCNPHVCADG